MAIRPPAHKPPVIEEGAKAIGDGSVMQDFHYAAIWASYVHCSHTCLRGFPHKVRSVHAVHDELHRLPAKARIIIILKLLHTDFVAHVDNMPPHFRSSFCNALAQAKSLILGPEPYPFPAERGK